MTSEWKLAKEFVKKYGLTEINASVMRETLKSQGYAVVEYSHASNSKSVEALLTSLKLQEYSSSLDAFTYVDDKMRIVFILENLSDEEQLVLLSHEEGHIFSGNITTMRINGDNVMAEKQANEFSHYILKMAEKQKLVSTFFKSPYRSTALFSVIVITVFAICTVLSAFIGFGMGKAKGLEVYRLIPQSATEAKDSFFTDESSSDKVDSSPDTVLPTDNSDALPDKTAIVSQNNEDTSENDISSGQSEALTEKPDKVTQTTPQVQDASHSVQQTQQTSVTSAAVQSQEYYYVTANGTKYHKAGCSYIKNKENLKQIPASEITSSGYEPCSRCIK